MLGDGTQIFGFGGAQNCCWNLRPPWPARWKLDPGEEGRKSSDLIQYHSTTQRDPPSSPLIRLIPHPAPVSDFLRLTTLKICDSLSHHVLLSEGAPPPFSYHPAGDRACQGDLCVLGASHLQDFCVLQSCALEGKIRQRVNKKSYPHPFLWPFKGRNVEFHRWYENPLETTATINKRKQWSKRFWKMQMQSWMMFGQKSGLRWKIVDPINVKGQKANCMWQLL